MAASAELRGSMVPSSLSKREVEPVPEHVLSIGAGTGPAFQPSPASPMSMWARFLNNISDSASNLANLLPTGTFLAFTTIAPFITDHGSCDDRSELWRSVGTTIGFAVFCFFSSFTDSFQAVDGNVYYGIVTFFGLWTPQLPAALRPTAGEKDKYKLTFLDFVYAILSLAVFAACTLMTENVRSCLFADLDYIYVRIIPGAVAIVVSALFTKFPSTRHPIGFPLSPATLTAVIQDITTTPPVRPKIEWY